MLCFSRRWYPAETITDADYADDLVLLANTPVQAKLLLHSLKQVVGGMCFKWEGGISTLSGRLLN